MNGCLEARKELNETREALAATNQKLALETRRADKAERKSRAMSSSLLIDDMAVQSGSIEDWMNGCLAAREELDETQVALAAAKKDRSKAQWKTNRALT